MEAERATSHASTLEKHERGFDRVIDEWRMKCDALANDLDSTQRDARGAATDVFKLRTQNEELHEKVRCPYV
jgi:myosin protein heavy chain